jgi:hypothetical protein
MLEANGNAPEVDTQIESLVEALYELATVQHITHNAKRMAHNAKRMAHNAKRMTHNA